MSVLSWSADSIAPLTEPSVLKLKACASALYWALAFWLTRLAGSEKIAGQHIPQVRPRFENGREAEGCQRHIDQDVVGEQIIDGADACNRRLVILRFERGPPPGSHWSPSRCSIDKHS